LTKIAPLSEVDVLITDTGASIEMLRAIETAGVQVVVAEAETTLEGDSSNE
jgi:hypothetical protein